MDDALLQLLGTGPKTARQWVRTTQAREAGREREKETVWMMNCGDDHISVEQVRAPRSRCGAQ